MKMKVLTKNGTMYDKQGMLVAHAVQVAEVTIGTTRYIEVGSTCYLAESIIKAGDRIVCEASGHEIVL